MKVVCNLPKTNFKSDIEAVKKNIFSLNAMTTIHQVKHVDSDKIS